MIGNVRVHLDALRANARALRDLVAPAHAAFVVKSNAYGHGLLAVSRAIEPFAQRLCVYGIDEAIRLRDGGVTRPIFVMGPIESADLNEALSRNLEIALWDTGAYLRSAVAAAARRHGRFSAHVKIDTGVARLGLDAHAAPGALQEYLRLPEIQIAGVFSHLAAAEELDSPFTSAQLQTFEHVLRSVQPAFDARSLRPLRHVAASAAAMLWPQTRLDMTRIGIALYGLWPSAQTRAAMNGTNLTLKPALSFSTKLVAIREVEAGTPIGYGCAYHAPKRTRIGVVPLGYVDGIPRLLSNCGAFVAGEARCPIVGRVCMNMTMIDLAPAPHACTGDTVTLIGGDGEASVTADEWAHWAQTIGYEIVARLPEHLPRSFHEAASA